MNGRYPSSLLEKAVNEFATLPGIGTKTAMRLVLHLLKQSDDAVDRFAEAIVRLLEPLEGAAGQPGTVARHRNLEQREGREGRVLGEQPLHLPHL